MHDKTVKIEYDGKVMEFGKDIDPKLNTDLKQPQKFKKFVKKPKEFLAKYNIKIDDALDELLKQRLSNFGSIKELERLSFAKGFTGMASAQGAIAVATAKGAGVAFPGAY